MEREDLDFISDKMKELEEIGVPNPRRLRQAARDLGGQIAFAKCFNKMPQLLDKDTYVLRWDSYEDFTHGGKSIKLVVGEASERIGNTGPRMKMNVSRKVVEKGVPDVYIPTAITLPYVQFLGYVEKQNMMKHLQKWYVSLSPNLNDLHPLWELESLESRRIRGRYV